MQPQKDRRTVNVRDLLESTETPFAVAGYGQRAVIFFQGDACDSVMHIEKGCVRLAVTAPSGKEVIVVRFQRAASGAHAARARRLG